MTAPRAKEKNDETAATTGDGQLLGSTPSSSCACRRNASSGSCDTCSATLRREGGVEALVGERLGKLLLLLLRVLLELLTLELDLGADELVL